jgi:hypothetical protein
MYRWWAEGWGEHGPGTYPKGGSTNRPVYWHRVGIAGSGGESGEGPGRWFRADVEYCLCFKRPGPLPYCNNTAMGQPCKWAPGGEMSYRNSEGTRRNQWGHSGTGERADRRKDGSIGKARRPSHRFTTGNTRRPGDGRDEGRAGDREGYDPPTLANPGNLIMGIPVGGGLMGHPLAHRNEAPFPERLVEWWIKSLTRPGDIVLDPFCGSGTTVAVAHRLGRHGIGIDIRASQIDLSRRRIETPQPPPEPARKKPWSVDNGLRGVLAGRIARGRRSLSALGRRAGVDPAVIMRFIKGERDIRMETAERLCKALDLVLVPRDLVADRVVGGGPGLAEADGDGEPAG